ncbi:MAG: aspartate-semialdehyde dehydrogenase [Planctomycetota bacterium]|nr:aspartate-semialdehyde dehydrogenase [Planctomycetota bacterium]
MRRRLAAILGATGVAGRQALRALEDHPWFELAAVASSPRTAGRRLCDVLDGEGFDVDPGALGNLVLQDAGHFNASSVDVVFSMLPSEVAARLEGRCAQTTPVLSTASAFRTEPDTPLLLAGVNPEQFEQLRHQRMARGWGGFVAPGPNCTTVGLALTLAPLHEAFGVRCASVTSMQAVSGAGSLAGAVMKEADGNVLPWIENEEEKVERECARIFGRTVKNTIEPASFPVSATCTRVPVKDGHTLSVALGLERASTPEEAAKVLSDHHPFKNRGLPSAPEIWIDVRSEANRPQPRVDCAAGAGFTTVVGRLRADPVLGGLKYLVVSHNAVMGAAGGAVLLAEDLLERGFLGD